MSEDLESLKGRTIKVLSADLGEVRKTLRKPDLTKEQRSTLISFEFMIQNDLLTLMRGDMSESTTREFCEHLIKFTEE